MEFCELIRSFTTSHWLSFIYFSVGNRIPFECHVFSSPSLQGVYCSPVSGQDTILDEGHTRERKGNLSLESAEPELFCYMSASKDQLTLTSLHNQSSWLIPAQDSLTSLSTTPKNYPQDRKMTNSDNEQKTEITGHLGSGEGEGIRFVGMGREHDLQRKEIRMPLK